MNNGQQTFTSAFPHLNHIFYRQLYNYVLNGYLQERYEKRIEMQERNNKIDILKTLLLTQGKEAE